MPASACGLIGLKPSRGRIPDPYQGLVQPGSVLGCVSRTVRDTAAYLDAVSGGRPGDYFTPPTSAESFLELLTRERKKLRVGLVTSMQSGFKIDAEIVACLNETAHLLESLGHLVDPCELSMSTEASREARKRIDIVQIRQRFLGWEATLGEQLRDDDIEPGTRAYIDQAKSISAITFAHDIEIVRTGARDVAEQLAQYDVVLCPVYPVHTFRNGEAACDAMSAEHRLAFGEFLSPINTCGVPAIALPVGVFRDGLPLGVQLVARYGDEATLLQIAAALEHQLRWHERQPPPVERC